jgi:hypothetical protein
MPSGPGRSCFPDSRRDAQIREVGAAIEIALLVGAASAEDEAKIVALASRVVSMLTRLIR